MTTLQMLHPEAGDDYTVEDAAVKLATVARVLRIARDDDEERDRKTLNDSHAGGSSLKQYLRDPAWKQGLHELRA